METEMEEEVQGQLCEAAAGDDDWADGGQVPGHSSLWGPAGVVGSAHFAQGDQAGGVTQDCISSVALSGQSSHPGGD